LADARIYWGDSDSGTRLLQLALQLDQGLLKEHPELERVLLIMEVRMAGMLISASKLAEANDAVDHLGSRYTSECDEHLYYKILKARLFSVSGHSDAVLKLYEGILHDYETHESREPCWQIVRRGLAELHAQRGELERALELLEECNIVWVITTGLALLT
jgi:hypothetical protein